LPSTTLGALTPNCSNLLRLRNSFSAHTLTIFRALREDEYSPLNRCSPTIYA
jgi:hypothetical protein